MTVEEQDNGQTGGADRGGPHPTKERILEAAEEVFAERGFEGASTREIAAKAQVNISSLHYHWASKDALYIAIVTRVLESLRERVRQSFVADGEGLDARQLIERSMGGVFDFFADNPHSARILLRRIVDFTGPAGAEAKDALGPSWRVFRDWAREFTHGVLSDADLNFLILAVQSVLLVTTLDSPYVSALRGGDLSNPEVRAGVRARLLSIAERMVAPSR
ncbi:MAG: TetR/AcrR family transcriptional regulator [Alphaproteobacteria bacterium]